MQKKICILSILSELHAWKENFNFFNYFYWSICMQRTFFLGLSEIHAWNYYFIIFYTFNCTSKKIFVYMFHSLINSFTKTVNIFLIILIPNYFWKLFFYRLSQLLICKFSNKIFLKISKIKSFKINLTKKALNYLVL